ncbi:hypothetical protein DUNSADRAFT_608 [Dunaliella salina]|uniref:Uncharacterized protein n=1 Tax=Dunaliella salina TaxID=3046 RepID=A0ABQ7FYN8_DUNSA|nr:hypothetical protein DUNSADRAFT_608 [Dunaliella salina]|eukprot:KAF5827473.1 hypothetical protein DUNSADRAFT_608 [Dunaliella salina]
MRCYCRMMLTKDPEERATVKELLGHRWFKQAAGAKMRRPNNLLSRRLRFKKGSKKEALRNKLRNLDAEYQVGVPGTLGAKDTSGSGNLNLEELLSALLCPSMSGTTNLAG